MRPNRIFLHTILMGMLQSFFSNGFVLKFSEKTRKRRTTLFSLTFDVSPLDFSGKKTLWIVGLGRVGACVAQEAAPYFDSILGSTTRKAREKPKNCAISGTRTPCNLKYVPLETFLASKNSTSCCTHLLVTIPGTATELCTKWNTGKDFAKHKKTNDSQSSFEIYDMLVNQMKSTQHFGWIGVLSTTSVYGNHEGAWVTEESDCLVDKNDTKAQQWLKYESSWKERVLEILRTNHTDDKNKNNQTSSNVALNIFRCAGIYGSTRSALHTVSKRGNFPKHNNRPNEISSNKTGGNPQLVTNRIHERDIARAIVASMRQCNGSSSSSSPRRRKLWEVYNLADDLPESRSTVMEYAADLLASTKHEKDEVVPLPNKENSSKETRPSARTQRRSRDIKRVDNTKMKRDLLDGSSLLFPTYKEGLQSILKNPAWMDHSS